MFFMNMFEVFFDAKPFHANFILKSFLLSFSVVIFDSVSDSLYSLLSQRINLTATFLTFSSSLSFLFERLE